MLWPGPDLGAGKGQRQSGMTRPTGKCSTQQHTTATAQIPPLHTPCYVTPPALPSHLVILPTLLPYISFHLCFVPPSSLPSTDAQSRAASSPTLRATSLQQLSTAPSELTTPPQWPAVSLPSQHSTTSPTADVHCRKCLRSPLPLLHRRRPAVDVPHPPRRRRQPQPSQPILLPASRHLWHTWRSHNIEMDLLECLSIRPQRSQRLWHRPPRLPSRSALYGQLWHHDRCTISIPRHQQILLSDALHVRLHAHNPLLRRHVILHRNARPVLPNRQLPLRASGRHRSLLPDLERCGDDASRLSLPTSSSC